MSKKVLWSRRDQVDALRHRQSEEADQPHVVVQGKPGDHLVPRRQFCGIATGIDIRAEHTVWDHDALGLAGGTARVLQNHEAFGIRRRSLESVAWRGFWGPRQYDPHRFERWIACRRHVEVGEQVVNQHDFRIAVTDSRPGILDEDVQRTHPHRQRQDHRRQPGQPAPSDDRHEFAAGRTKNRHMISRHQTPGLQRGADNTCFVVDLIPADGNRTGHPHHRLAYEPNSRAGVGGKFQALNSRQRRRHPSNSSAAARTR